VLRSQLKDASPRTAAIGRLGSAPTRHVGLRNLIQQQDERVAGEEYTAFCATLSPARSPTWAWLAHRLTSQMAYDSGGSVERGRTAPRRTLL